MKISVVVATFNGQKYIEEQLLSIANQTRKPDEVIIGDDCSTDNTVDIVKKFIEKHGLTWKIIINKNRLGFGKNFFSLVELCTGDVVFPSDQDDIWRIDKIDVMYRIMKKDSNIGVLISEYMKISEESSIDDVNRIKVHDDMKVNSISLMQVLYRKDKKCPFAGMAQCIRMEFYRDYFSKMSNCPIVHDKLFVLVAADNDKFYKINYTSVFHRVHLNNTSGVTEHSYSKILDCNFEKQFKLINRFRTENSSYINSGIDFSNSLYEYFLANDRYHGNRLIMMKSGNIKGLIQLFVSNRKKGVLSLLTLFSDVKYSVLYLLLR